MLHILGMILKIAGILLGSILGIFLLATLLILFVPIRYQVNGSYQEKINVKAKISWLLSIVKVSIQYGEKGISFKIALFGISLGKKKEQKKILVREKENSEIEKVQETKEIKENKGIQETKEIKEKKEIQEAKEIEEKKEIREEKEESKEKFSFTKKIREIQEKIKYTICTICDKIKTARKKVEDIKDFLQDEKNKEAFRLIKGQLLLLWKHTKPRKYSVTCHFGFEDPAITGQLLGAASMFMPLYKNKVQLYPDFNQKVFLAEGFLKGRVRIFPLFLIILRLWRNKQVRSTVRKFIK
ncbi:MAG: DUF2953 domain-containing protein [Lachnospiraceae bacterium]|nr:DUF2953 domain-containing protein [Lachnospiraceae bacterium]